MALVSPPMSEPLIELVKVLDCPTLKFLVLSSNVKLELPVAEKLKPAPTYT
jgi:hypothetical protein